MYIAWTTLGGYGSPEGIASTIVEAIEKMGDPERNCMIYVSEYDEEEEMKGEIVLSYSYDAEFSSNKHDSVPKDECTRINLIENYSDYLI